MSTAPRSFEPISVDDYLSGELVAAVRHEYVSGKVYAMSGGTVNHSRIAGNIFAALHSALRDNPRQPFNSDMKVRVRESGQTFFYYPDVSVVCQSNPDAEVFQDRPVVIFEVLSRSTRRVDEGEKLDAYFSIPELAAYLLVEQDQPAVKIYRRGEGGSDVTVVAGADGSIRLPEINVELTLTDVYRDIRFTLEPDDPEQNVFPQEN